MGIYKSLIESQTHKCDVEIAIEAAQFLFWKYINGILVAVWAETTPAYDGPGCVGGGGEEGAQQPLQLVLCVLPAMSGRSTEQVLDSLHATEVIAKSLKGLAIK